MRRPRVSLLVIACSVCALLLSPCAARADSLAGTVGFKFLYPDVSTTLFSDTIGVGSSLSCPSAAPVCLAYANEPVIFSVGPSAISYTASTTSTGYGAPPATTFNGFAFTDMTFLGGGYLTGFLLTTDIAGLDNSKVTFGPSLIEINMLGLAVNGDFKLDLVSSGAAVPEPSSLALLGTGLLALIGFALRKAMA